MPELDFEHIRPLQEELDRHPDRIAEAEGAAEEAICARLRLWDGVCEAIERGRGR